MAKAREENKEIKKEKQIRWIYIGPNIYEKGLVFGKVYTYEPKHLIENMPEIKNLLISSDEFSKNRAMIGKQGSKYDILIKEFQKSIRK
ncbi:MAG: hypothetical protein ACRCY7_03315 [Cetobacterium sp.]|uniref:hypothetical protein n=1 Tax=Cetobacterium sp. TaxID=2071632 RepID=UPI003F3F427D